MFKYLQKFISHPSVYGAFAALIGVVLLTVSFGWVHDKLREPGRGRYEYTAVIPPSIHPDRPGLVAVYSKEAIVSAKLFVADTSFDVREDEPTFVDEQTLVDAFAILTLPSREELSTRFGQNFSVVGLELELRRGGIRRIAYPPRDASSYMLSTDRTTYAPGDAIKTHIVLKSSTRRPLSDLKGTWELVPLEHDRGQEAVYSISGATDAYGSSWSTLYVPLSAPLGSYFVRFTSDRGTFERPIKVNREEIPFHKIGLINLDQIGTSNTFEVFVGDRFGFPVEQAEVAVTFNDGRNDISDLRTTDATGIASFSDLASEIGYAVESDVAVEVNEGGIRTQRVFKVPVEPSGTIEIQGDGRSLNVSDLGQPIGDEFIGYDALGNKTYSGSIYDGKVWFRSDDVQTDRVVISVGEKRYEHKLATDRVFKNGEVVSSDDSAIALVVEGTARAAAAKGKPITVDLPPGSTGVIQHFHTGQRVRFTVPGGFEPVSISAEQTTTPGAFEEITLEAPEAWGDAQFLFFGVDSAAANAAEFLFHDHVSIAEPSLASFAQWTGPFPRYVVSFVYILLCLAGFVIATRAFNRRERRSFSKRVALDIFWAILLLAGMGLLIVYLAETRARDAQQVVTLVFMLVTLVSFLYCLLDRDFGAWFFSGLVVATAAAFASQSLTHFSDLLGTIFAASVAFAIVAQWLIWALTFKGRAGAVFALFFLLAASVLYLYAKQLDDEHQSLMVATTHSNDEVATPSAATVRSWFPKTMVFLPNLSGDPTDATVNVRIPDQMTTWRFQTLAMSRTGKTGVGRATMSSLRPYEVDLFLPSELIQGDRVDVKGLVANHSETAKTFEVRAVATGGVRLEGFRPYRVDLGANERKTVPLQLIAKQSNGVVQLALYDDGVRVDAIEKTVTVKRHALASVVVQNQIATEAFQKRFNEPQDVVVYPDVISHVADGLSSIITRPTGCFEQTSSKHFPNVVIAEALRTTNKLTREQQRIVDAGHARLLTFQNRDGGFGIYPGKKSQVRWTALAVRQFAASKHLVDASAELNRAISYLRDSGDRSNRIAYSLAVAGVKDASSFFESTSETTISLPDLGFKILALAELGQHDEAGRLSRILLDRLSDSNGFRLERHTWRIVIPAMAAIGLRGSNPSRANELIENLFDEKRGDGGWGNTRATRWAIKALLSGRSNQKPGKVWVNDALIPRDDPVAPIFLRLERGDQLRVEHAMVQIREPVFTKWSRVPSGPISVQMNSKRAARVGMPHEVEVVLRPSRWFQNVTLELPIGPSGIPKRDDLGEFTEYTAQSIVVYLDQLSQETRFRYTWKPTFAGRYRLPPLKVYPYYEQDLATSIAGPVIEVSGRAP